MLQGSFHSSIEVMGVIFDDVDLHKFVEPSDGDFPLNKLTELSDEKFVQMVYELEHAF